jgi:hypothetical protein
MKYCKSEEHPGIDPSLAKLPMYGKNAQFIIPPELLADWPFTKNLEFRSGYLGVLCVFGTFFVPSWCLLGALLNCLPRPNVAVRFARHSLEITNFNTMIFSDVQSQYLPKIFIFS